LLSDKEIHRETKPKKKKKKKKKKGGLGGIFFFLNYKKGKMCGTFKIF